MANVLIFGVCLVSVLSRAESCFQASSVSVSVPAIIPPGYQLAKVADCDTASASFTVSDPSFAVTSGGVVEAVSAVKVSPQGRTFSVSARDSGGLKAEMEVHLVRSALLVEQPKGEALLKRSKRRWSPPPFNILENDKGPFPMNVEEIVSDSAANYNVYYTLSGPGLDENPVGVFALKPNTGMLTVLKTVDREEFPVFRLTARVFNERTGKETDNPLPITIIVDDVNDNAPTFTGSLECTVLEQSKAGTVVGKLNATDRDQEGTLHVKIKYSLVDGQNLFAIDPQTGVITTVTNTLDRETKDKHLVIVQIKDMNGQGNGLSNTGTATITLADINDNPPTFTKPSYQVSVKENEKDKLILRIPVEDKDLVNTPNWISKFVISKGNEGGNFRIDADPETNEGLLYVLKPLDYEKTKNVKLEIMARNEAELSNTKAQWNTIPLDVAVTNVDEGPEFTPPTIRINVKENIQNNTVIGSYTAVDPETKSSSGISYYKVLDPASWISVNKNTGELRVANTIDRESKFVQDGMYNITMKAVDSSSKTGTGTVILVVEDVNDNIPVFPPGEMVLCEKEGELGSVVVVAEDKDQVPLSAPFSFTLPADHDNKWSLILENDTAVRLQQMKELPRGIHTVHVDVKDLQSNGGIQTVKIRICECKNGACLAKEHSVSLGGLALLAMLLPLVLLLLLCLLLIFFCVTKTDKIEFEDVGDSGGILLKSNTEAPGEEVDSSLIAVPTIDPAVKGLVKRNLVSAGLPGALNTGIHSTHDQGMFGVTTADMQEYYSGQYDRQYGTQQFNRDYLGDTGMDFDSKYQGLSSGFLHTWQTNGLYLQQKLAFLGSEEDGRYADDIIHSYRFEGVGSAAGSVGCCSDCGDTNDLDFLNTLGPKFKTLADVCKKT